MGVNSYSNDSGNLCFLCTAPPFFFQRVQTPGKATAAALDECGFLYVYLVRSDRDLVFVVTQGWSLGARVGPPPGAEARLDKRRSIILGNGGPRRVGFIHNSW